MDKTFIHVPKTAGTSIRETLELSTKFYHKRLKDYDEIPRNTFTVVRNPYDRAVSICAHQLGVASPETFQKWCRSGKGIRLYKKYNIYLADPMVDFISVGGTVFITDILRFETLTEDFTRLFKTDLLHLNKGYREEYQQYYDEDSFNIITSRYSDDIKTFDYSF